MDDKIHVKFDSETLPGPQLYTKQQGSIVSDTKSPVRVEKFVEKALVWQAI